MEIFVDSTKHFSGCNSQVNPVVKNLANKGVSKIIFDDIKLIFFLFFNFFIEIKLNNFGLISIRSNIEN